MLSAADLNDPKKVGIAKGSPVCGVFVASRGTNGYTPGPNGIVPAASQSYPVTGTVATDIYVNTKQWKNLSQGTILHEALHNLTGLYDDDLENLLNLDLKKDCSNGTICITNAVIGAGCAGTQ